MCLNIPGFSICFRFGSFCALVPLGVYIWKHVAACTCISLDYLSKFADLPVSLCPSVLWVAGVDLPAEILWLDVSPFHPLRPSSWGFSSLLEEHRCRQATGKVQSGISCVGESKEVLLHMRSSSNLSALLEVSPFPKLCFTHVHKLKHYNQCNCQNFLLK